MSVALPLPNPNMGAVKVWIVPLPPSWNARHKPKKGGGVYVDPAVQAWEWEALAMLRDQGWEKPQGLQRFTLAIRWWFPNDAKTDGDKRECTLLDFLKSPTVLNLDDSACWSCMWEKRIDRKAPRCEFIVTPYAYTA